MKYVLVTGGVVSGLGKGVTASSIGVLLQHCGHRITHIKIDPYLNIDAGTMSPFEHGEVFVLDDGGEVDLDLGNYERFLDITLSKNHNITTGKIYQNVINKERKGDYLGKTVQVVPHITDEIQDWIQREAVKPCDGSGCVPNVCVIELGGVVGDIESAPFVEALRQLQFRVGRQNFCIVHVSLVPIIGVVGEQKTKPTQHSVQVLRSLGLNCDILAVRTSDTLEQGPREKLSIFCHVPPENVLNIADVSNIWWVPVMLREQGAHRTISQVLGLPNWDALDISKWETQLAVRSDVLKKQAKTSIAVIGKYTDLSDAYQSVVKALLHAALAANLNLNILWVEAEHLLDPSADSSEAHNSNHESAWAHLRAADGILVPGGFGLRGVEGKVLAVNYARVNKVPFLGVCLGMQVAVIEFARNVLGLSDAHSQEFEPACAHPAVVFMPEGSRTHKGGTMRLGSRDTILQTTDCMAARLYKKTQEISERHRHRYEINPSLVNELKEAGLDFVGTDETGTRMEIMELAANPEDHPFFLGVQFHPEFKSRPLKPSPPYLGFMLAAGGKLDSYFTGHHVTHDGAKKAGDVTIGSSPYIGISTGGMAP